jgi:hypothetical protein
MSVLGTNTTDRWLYINIYICIYACKYVYEYIYMNLFKIYFITWIFINICIYVYIYIDIYIYIYIYICTSYIGEHRVLVTTTLFIVLTTSLVGGFLLPILIPRLGDYIHIFFHDNHDNKPSNRNIIIFYIHYRTQYIYVIIYINILS